MSDGNVAVNGDTITVTGTFNETVDTDWMIKTWNEVERTGYYLPIILNAEDGSVLRTTTMLGTTKDLVFGQTNDPAGTMVLCLAVADKAPRTKVVTVFDKADTNFENGKEFTIDYSGCTFKAHA